MHRRTSLIMSSAATVLSIGYFVSLYQLVHIRILSSGADAYFRTAVAGECAEILGLCLAALGFWLGSRRIGQSDVAIGVAATPDDLAPVDIGIG